MELYFKSLLALTVMVTMCAGTRTIYLRDYCNPVLPYKVVNDLRIKLFYQRVLYETRDCEMQLQVNNASRLVARFRSYTQGTVDLFSSNCPNQAIYLSNYFGSDGYCGVPRPTGDYDLGTLGTYRYFVKKFSAIFGVNLAEAELIVTEVTDKKGATCPPGYFDCERNNYCVSNEVTCNGYDNCGNDRDEIEGCGLTKGAIIGIVCGGVAFVVIVVIVIACFVKHR